MLNFINSFYILGIQFGKNTIPLRRLKISSFAGKKILEIVWLTSKLLNYYEMFE